MTVGTDSYVTVEEADDYVEAHFASTSAQFLRWDGLSDSDKAAYLVAACTEIEALPISGEKQDFSQVMAFPRYPLWQYPYNEFPRLPESQIPDGTVPTAVKSAQIELAVWLSDTTKQADMSQRASLQAQGVKSFSIGNLSETYGAAEQSPVLLCPVAARLMRPYMGSFATC